MLDERVEQVPGAGLDDDPPAELVEPLTQARGLLVGVGGERVEVRMTQGERDRPVPGHLEHLDGARRADGRRSRWFRSRA